MNGQKGFRGTNFAIVWGEIHTRVCGEMHILYGGLMASVRGDPLVVCFFP